MSAIYGVFLQGWKHKAVNEPPDVSKSCYLSLVDNYKSKLNINKRYQSFSSININFITVIYSSRDQKVQTVLCVKDTKQKKYCTLVQT